MRGGGEGRPWRPAQALRVRLKRFKQPVMDKTRDVVSLEGSGGPVLGGVPSPEEVEAAADELLTVHSDSLSLICKDIVSGEHPATIVPANNTVAQCLNLFHHNVHVQGTVKSLAKDPAMWDAFVKNEKVRELMQRETSLPALLSHPEVAFQEHLNPFASAFNSMATVMRELMGAFLDLTHLLLKVIRISGQKGTGTRKEQQQPFKACMVLTILILAVVLLHRLP